MYLSMVCDASFFMNNEQLRRIMTEKKIQIGGQAVIEGVMMRGPDQIATAIRRKDGLIEIWEKPFVSVTKEHRLGKLPVIRGFVSLIEMMILGFKTLSFSADRSMLDMKNEEQPIAKLKPSFWQKIIPPKIEETLTFVFAFILAFGLFGFVPYLLTGLIKISNDNVLFNTSAGIMRIIFFVLYVYIISLTKDVRRVFEYHGAEHKSVFAHEQNVALTIDNVRPFTTIHPRCGTSFMFLVLLISILLFSIIDTLVDFFLCPYSEMPQYFFALLMSEAKAKSLGAFLRLLFHLPFIPLISGIGYEIIKISSQYPKNVMINIFTFPGMALQKLTTKEPDDQQIEVAIVALKAALKDDLSMHNPIKIINANDLETK